VVVSNAYIVTTFCRGKGNESGREARTTTQERWKATEMIGREQRTGWGHGLRGRVGEARAMLVQVGRVGWDRDARRRQGVGSAELHRRGRRGDSDDGMGGGRVDDARVHT
jgi:hypothetical protein